MSSADGVEPCADLLVLVGGIIVEDHMDDVAGREVSFQIVQETDESSRRWAANKVVVPLCL